MTTRDYKSVLSDEVYDRARAALNKGPVFGFHLYCGGGRSGSPFVLSDFDSFVKYVSAARTGDILLIWSTAELEDRNKFIEKAQSSASKASGWIEKMLQRVSVYLRQELHEVFIIYGPDKDHLQSLIVDVDGLKDLQQLATDAERGGFVGVYPFTDIDHDEFYLLKTKRPDREGRVPASGAY